MNKVITPPAILHPMHEVSIVSNLVKSIISELENHNFSKVNSVTVVIGDMTNLGKDQMEFAYEVVTRDTILEGSEIIVMNEPIEVECVECKYVGLVKTIKFDEDYGHSVPILACPECNSKVTIIKGESCRIESIDVEE